MAKDKDRHKGKPASGSDTPAAAPEWELNDWTPYTDRNGKPPRADADYALDLREVDPSAAELIAVQRRMTFHAVGCSGDPTPGSERPQDEVALAMAGQLAAPGAPSFLYHLGDIAYKEDEDELAAARASQSRSGGGLSGISELDARLASLDPVRDTKRDVREAAEAYFDALYAEEFYGAYAAYSREIFAIPGNHDGKDKPKNLSLEMYRRTFCSSVRRPSGLPGDDSGRRTMIQPNLFWRLDTPVAHIVGLYANVANGGLLDDPSIQNPADADAAPQLGWLVRQLDWLKRHRGDRALLLAVHYPPYSAALNYELRGDPRLGKRSQTRDDHTYPNARALALVLNTAFERTGVWPDAVLSAHAHLYQRLTFVHPESGRQIPYLIAGTGGHAPGESLWQRGEEIALPSGPPAIVQPQGFDTLQLPGSDGKLVKVRKPAAVHLEQYNDTAYGFLRMSIDLNQRTLSGEFVPVLRNERERLAAEPLRAAYDCFTLDLDRHRLVSGRLSGERSA